MESEKENESERAAERERDCVCVGGVSKLKVSLYHIYQPLRSGKI